MTRVSGIAGAFVVTLALAPIALTLSRFLRASTTTAVRSGSSLKVRPAGPPRAWSPGMSSDHKGRLAQPVC